MKKIAALLVAALPLVVTGCVQSQMETVLEKDGSGTFFLTYAMSQDVAEALQEMGNLEMPGQEGQEKPPTLDDFDKAKLEEACKKNNVSLKKFDRSTKDGKETVELALAFKRVQDLESVMGSLGEAGGSGGLQLFKTPAGDYHLKLAEGSREDSTDDAEAESPPTGPPDMSNFDPQAMQKSMEVMGKLMGSISELDVTMKITVPGEVLEHNAHRLEGKTLIWELNADNMMSAGQAMEPDIVFSGKGVKIDAKPEG